MSKAKILLVGAVEHRSKLLADKLKALQESKAGPFDVCFCVGRFGTPQDEDASCYKEFPLPVYLQDYAGTLTPIATTTDGIAQISTNLFYLRGSDQEDKANLNEIKLPHHPEPLLVATCPRQVRMDTENSKDLLEKCSSADYHGCDLLLTSDWPQGIEEVLQVDNAALSYDLSRIALKVQPRYHVACSNQYHQSPAFQYTNDSGTIGRFIALAPVRPGKSTKATKFIHALGLQLAAPSQPLSASALPCPYESSRGKPNGIDSGKPPPSSVRKPEGMSFSRFGDHGKRGRDDNGEDPVSLEPPEDDPNLSTLFLYGLHKDVSGELQSTSSSILLEVFANHGVKQVRHPPAAKTSTYCFLEFGSQEDALKCLLECQPQVEIKGVPLTLKWATHSANKRPKLEKVRHFVKHEEASDSTTLYFHPPKEFQGDFEKLSEKCRAFLEKVLEDALNEGNNEDDRVTASTEEALQVKFRSKDSYGFFEFASHAAATMALAAATTSIDGGLVVSDHDNAPKPPSPLVGATLRWSKGAPQKKEKDKNYLEALGLERKHFPKDARTDCWFCLASPTCEKHMILSVHDLCYSTLPKGPVHQGHVLLVPVTHSSSGAWTLNCAEEMATLKERMRIHASQEYDCDLFVFERAIDTKGGYHTHIQCVPIARGLSAKLQATMLAHAKASNFELRLVQSNLGMQAIINDKEDYFYAEINSDQKCSRFVCQRDVERVPLQFGREVLASILKKPELAHWRSCMLNHAQEIEFAEAFRESFGAING
jgi:RNA recognition motif-containing protein